MTAVFFVNDQGIGVFLLHKVFNGSAICKTKYI